MPATSTACRTARSILKLVLGFIGHNLALLAACRRVGPRWHSAGWRAVAADHRPCSGGPGRAGPNPGVESLPGAQYLDHPGHRCGRAATRRGVFRIYLKTDWGISLFFLTPLALVAIPALRLPRHGAFPHRRDLARRDTADAAGIANHRRARDGGQSGLHRDLWRTLRARTRTHRGLAPQIFFALGGGGGHHGRDRTAGVL